MSGGMRTMMMIMLLIVPAMCAASGDIRFDFETGDLQGWQVMEGEFGTPVSSREMCRNYPGEKLNKQGDYFLGTLELANDGYDDAMTGVIESPVFVLRSKQATFLQGGGGHPDTYVALCTMDGAEVLKSKGKNDERFRPVVWDTSKLVGKRVFIQIVDKNTGSWGHVTFDDFRAEGEIDMAATKEVRASYQRRKEAELAREKATKANWEVGKVERMKQLISDEYLFKQGATRIYKGEHLGAIDIPIGGIGAGCIQMNGKAERGIWQIFNNFSYLTVPDSFFAVRASTGDGRSVVRALQTEPVGPFAAMKELTFKGEYPFAWYNFKDSALPVRVSMEAFSPFIPLNAKDSAIPCAMFNLTAYNPTSEPIEVSFMASQQNAVGFTGKVPIDGRMHDEYGGNTNRIIRGAGCTTLHMASNIPKAAPGYGDMALMALAEDTSGTADWSDVNRLHDDFAGNGSISGAERTPPSPEGRTVNGALVTPFILDPGEKKTVSFVLTWYFPNGKHGEGVWGDSGNMYTNWWPDALSAASDLKERLPDLTSRTRLYHDTLYASNLPHWLLDRISSQAAVLRSHTCFWSKSGYFGGWEGCGTTSGCCQGNCTHVWHYAQTQARLFPEISRIITEEELGYVTETGALPHRQYPGLEQAADGQFGAILGAYREYQICGDRQWLDKQWPHIKLMMQNAISTWDADHDGVMIGRQWNTLDDALTGSSSWIGSLYLTALAACEKMADIQGETESARLWANIRVKGAEKQNETLFNGEYYIQIPDDQPGKDYAIGCHIDQLLGQWWAHQLDLGWIYPPDRVRTALRSLVKYNFKPNFNGIIQTPRKFVDDGDSGMQMITWPKDGKPAPEHLMFYGDEVMTGFEYSAAATMVQAGLLREGFAIARAIYDRYDGRLRTDLTAADTASWGYSGNPFGDDECGKFYARAMSSWSLLFASQGFIYDASTRTIGFKPVWKPENHVSFFTAAKGYGLFSQKRTSKRQIDRIEVKSGKVEIKTLVIEPPTGMTPSDVKVTLSRERLRETHALTDGVLTITLDSKITVNQGQTLEVVVKG